MSDDSYKIVEDEIGPGFTCENCGSQSFKVEGDEYVCQSCGTSYRIVRKQEPVQNINTNPQPQQAPKTIPQQQKQQNTANTDSDDAVAAACCLGIIIFCVIIAIISAL